SSTSFSSSSPSNEASVLLPPGTLYMVKRKRTLPPRPCGELRSMSRTWCTPPLCSTTLPFLTSQAFIAGSSAGCQAHGAVQADGFAVDVAVAGDVCDHVGELLRAAQARREGDRCRQRLLHVVRHAIDHRRPEDARGDGVD